MLTPTPFPARHHCLSVALLIGLCAVSPLRAQFVAFNDHYAGPGTHANATAWNVFGTTGGAPGTGGPLRDITSGGTLGVVLNITTNNAVQGGTTSGAPSPGTPAYNVFNNFI